MDGKQDYDVLGFIYEYLISNFAYAIVDNKKETNFKNNDIIYFDKSKFVNPAEKPDYIKQR